MPRRSAASLAVASIEVNARRIKPPPGLPAPVTEIWETLVGSLPANRFHVSDRPLLALYCRALHQAELAFLKLEEFGAAAGDNVSPWLRVCDSALKSAATLATKLRLCPQARADRKTAGIAARNDHAGPQPWDPMPRKPE
ncbi:MAG TPA: P27 family phage terminase small subunit [Burkholderiales bacterium]|nr:P27 family phage terminase small subunit [Burkholderiales bacterium]